jgi:hypothetical protein
MEILDILMFDPLMVMLTLRKLSFLFDSAKKIQILITKFTSFFTSVNIKMCVILLRHFVFFFYCQGEQGKAIIFFSVKRAKNKI